VVCGGRAESGRQVGLGKNVEVEEGRAPSETKGDRSTATVRARTMIEVPKDGGPGRAG